MAISPNYQPDPHRALFVVGEIGQQLVDRLTPQIVSLRASLEPISVYIESPGGNVECAAKILSLLLAKDQNGFRSRILTIATGLAASAAADILTFGDYSLAYPHSVIHYHGTRWAAIDVTYQEAAGLAASLDSDDTHFARRIFEACEERFYFRCMTVQSRPDFKAWIDLTLNELSAIGRGVANDALRDVKGFRSTVEKFKDQSRSDVQMLRALINRKFPRSTTSISRQTAFQALAEFFSLRFYLEMFSAIKTGPAYQHWLEKWTEDDAKMRLLSDEALVDASTTSWAAAEEFWIFFVALCRRLQQDENPLTAADAFHLGLIDEVIGLASPNLRVFVENARDPL